MSTEKSDIVDISTSTGWNFDKVPTGQELVHKLVVGPQAIDQMRHEIKCVVKTTLGLVSHHLEKQGDPRLKNYYIKLLTLAALGNDKWEITIMPPSEDGRLVADYAMMDHNFQYLKIYDSRKVDSLPLEFTQRVQESLPSFVDNMVEIFPFLKEQLRPLLDAADYAEKKGWKF